MDHLVRYPHKRYKKPSIRPPKKPWIARPRIACTSGSLSGLVAATQAGLGLMAHSRKLIPQGLIERAPVEGMPELGDLEFVMLRTRRSSQAPVAELSAMILAKGENF